MSDGQGASWPPISELVDYALAPDDTADSEFYARLRRAHAADPDAGGEVFLRLLRNPLSRVREFAVNAGPELGAGTRWARQRTRSLRSEAGGHRFR